jgi:hypothetical protein
MKSACASQEPKNSHQLSLSPEKAKKNPEVRPRSHNFSRFNKESLKEAQRKPLSEKKVEIDEHDAFYNSLVALNNSLITHLAPNSEDPQKTFCDPNGQQDYKLAGVYRV